MTTPPVIDLIADLIAQDDDGLGWSMLADGTAPSASTPVPCSSPVNAQAQAVVRVVAVDDDGQIHFAILPASVDMNRHLLDR
jgi:hypothetical protein